MPYLLSSVPVLLFVTGVFYLFRLRGFFLRHPVHTLRHAFKSGVGDGISPYRALTVALAGTLGVGNIAGVATALYLGGAGAVLWMVVSALVAMILKYAEIVLAVKYRRIDSDGQPMGGAPYYMVDGLARRGAPRLGRAVAWAFALLCLINTLTIGSIVQSNAVVGALEGGFGIPMWLSGIVLVAFSAFVTLGGVRRIAAMTERIVPVMTVGFLVLCFAVIILRRDRIGMAFERIVTDAFSPAGAGAGVLGFLLSRGIRYGVMRGLASNEAGCGTAPMAHATANTHSPAAQGVLGLVEVFIDTVLLCTVTALAIIVSDSGMNAFGEDGIRTAQAAFSSVLGGWAGGFFAVSVLLFGLATILCWAHYGMTCMQYLTPTRTGRVVYYVLFYASVLVGAFVTPAGAWSMADVALGVMTILNLLVLLVMNRDVAEESRVLMCPEGVCTTKRKCE